MSNRFAAVSLVISSSLMVFPAGHAGARTCKAKVTGKNVSATVEQATNAAKIQWSGTAKRTYGANYADWAKAENGKVNCKDAYNKGKKMKFCAASGKPCAD